jgi:hypothetical protein
VSGFIEHLTVQDDIADEGISKAQALLELFRATDKQIAGEGEAHGFPDGGGTLGGRPFVGHDNQKVDIGILSVSLTGMRPEQDNPTGVEFLRHGRRNFPDVIQRCHNKKLLIQPMTGKHLRISPNPRFNP